MLPPDGFREPWVSLAFERRQKDNMKIRENQPETPEAITRFSQSADSFACRKSIASVKISESLRHAPTGTGCGYATRSTDTRFLNSTIHAHGFIQCRQWMNVGFQISDSAHHAASLFQVSPSATQTSSVTSGYCAESALWPRRISNHTLHPTALRAGFCKSAVLTPPAQSRMLLPQPPRLRLTPFYCHPPLTESRG